MELGELNSVNILVWQISFNLCHVSFIYIKFSVKINIIFQEVVH